MGPDGAAAGQERDIERATERATAERATGERASLRIEFPRVPLSLHKLVNVANTAMRGLSALFATLNAGRPLIELRTQAEKT